MTCDELIAAARPQLARIDFGTVAADQLLFIVEDDGAPVLRVWSVDQALERFGHLPGLAEELTRPRHADQIARVAIITATGELGVDDVLVTERTPLRVVN